MYFAWRQSWLGLLFGFAATALVLLAIRRRDVIGRREEAHAVARLSPALHDRPRFLDGGLCESRGRRGGRGPVANRLIR